MLVGFIHGVMNTDNMAISGETIDYGPCAFMDAFDPPTVFSSIDHGGRYAYGNQPRIAQWNLARLAETLLPLLDAKPQTALAQATAVLDSFPDRYRAALAPGDARKLGLADGAGEGDALVDDLLALLEAHAVDFTTCFRALAASAARSRGPFAVAIRRVRRLRRVVAALARRALVARAPLRRRSPTRWTGSIRPTYPATITWRRRWRRRAPATSTRSNVCSTSSLGRLTNVRVSIATPHQPQPAPAPTARSAERRSRLRPARPRPPDAPAPVGVFGSLTGRPDDALHGILELRFGEHALAQPAPDSESLELRIAA